LVAKVTSKLDNTENLNAELQHMLGIGPDIHSLSADACEFITKYFVRDGVCVFVFTQ